MPRKYHVYTIEFRPVWRSAKPKVRTVRSATVVARSQQDAILMFKEKAPEMFVLSCERGEQTDPPPSARIRRAHY